MIVDCGPTWEERRRMRLMRLQEWHDFFAIWPRRIDNNKCAFLQKIKRRGTLRPPYSAENYWNWEYKL